MIGSIALHSPGGSHSGLLDSMLARYLVLLDHGCGEMAFAGEGPDVQEHLAELLHHYEQRVV